jgi:hypothetical protein
VNRGCHIQEAIHMIKEAYGHNCTMSKTLHIIYLSTWRLPCDDSTDFSHVLQYFVACVHSKPDPMVTSCVILIPHYSRGSLCYIHRHQMLVGYESVGIYLPMSPYYTSYLLLISAWHSRQEILAVAAVVRASPKLAGRPSFYTVVGQPKRSGNNP